MPTYEYVCTSCGHRLEAVQPFSDPALTTCPVCQGVLRKVFGNVGIVLKGSGFYKNDSRSSARSNGFGPTKETLEKESSSTGESSGKDSSTKDSSTKESSGKDSGSTKDAPASTPASSSKGGSGASEKAAASSS